MTGVFFSLAFFVAVGALGWRAWAKRRALAALETRIAAHDTAPIDVPGFEGVDARVERARCPACGARCTRLSEGPSTVPDVFAVQLRCAKCATPLTLRFRLPTAIQ